MLNDANRKMSPIYKEPVVVRSRIYKSMMGILVSFSRFLYKPMELGQSLIDSNIIKQDVALTVHAIYNYWTKL